MKAIFTIILTLLFLTLFPQSGQLITDTIRWDNGRVKYIESYNDRGRDFNNREGQFLQFYETGELDTIKYYKNGSQDSIFTHFYKNGNIQKQGYLKPWEVGIWTTWFENGKKESSGECEGNTRLGKWIFWDSTGREINEVIYSDSTYTSTFFYYYPNGQMESIKKYRGPYKISARLILYENGVKPKEESEIIKNFATDYQAIPSGVWQKFDENGALKEEEIYGN